MQKRILIIEGEDDVRASAQAALERAGYEVITAARARQGVHLAERQQPDAILVDVVMPDIDGPRTVSELRANPSTRDIPVIFLTTDDGNVFENVDLLGAIPKPFDPETLHEQVRRLLGW